jgi:hypothetical protein
VNRLKLTFIIGIAQLLCGDVGRKLDHLVRLAARVQQRIVGSLDPHRSPALGDSLELLGLIFAAAQRIPKLAIFSTVTTFLVDEHAVMLAADFLERISHRIEKIRVRGDDRPVEIELNDGLRPVQRIEFRVRIARCR